MYVFHETIQIIGRDVNNKIYKTGIVNHQRGHFYNKPARWESVERPKHRWFNGVETNTAS